MALIWPGLNLIAENYLIRVKQGESPNAYPFRLYPLRGFDFGTWSQDLMWQILTLRDRLEPKVKHGGRVPLDFIDLRVLVLAARITVKLRRAEAAYLKRAPDSASQKTRRLSPEAIRKLKTRKDRVVLSLERQTKRANRRFIKTRPPGEFKKRSNEWRRFVRWIHFHLAYFKALASLNRRGFRKLFQIRIDQFVEVAKDALRSEGYQMPDARELRRIVRMFLRSARRGRQIAIFAYDRLFRNRYDPVGRSYLVEFIERRLELKESS